MLKTRNNAACDIKRFIERAAASSLPLAAGQ
jgi:hypothetical protein